MISLLPQSAEDAAMNERLNTLLTELVAELRAARSLDEPTRQRLAEAASAMIAALHRDESPAGGDADSGSLKDRIIELEASHPNLAAVLNRLIDMLAQMGI
jgi:hypothetical protein